MCSSLHRIQHNAKQQLEIINNEAMFYTKPLGWIAQRDLHSDQLRYFS